MNKQDNQNKWIRLRKRVLKVSSVSAMNYNAEKQELRVYENSGYTNVLLATEKEVASLTQVLDIKPQNLILEIGE